MSAPSGTTETVNGRRTSTSSGSEPGRGFVLAAMLLAGLFMAMAGMWALLAPGSFADFAGFPRHTHFVHDAGAFQLGIGATLLLALAWRDAPALALAGFLVSGTVHAINHAVDLDLGGPLWAAWGLAVLSLVIAVALAVRLRQIGWVIGEVSTAATAALEPFVRQKTALLTTYRRDGSPVGTPLSIAVDGDRAYIRTFERAWKTKRMSRNPMVEVAPSTARGRATGPATAARARRLTDAESRYAARLLTGKHPLLHGVLVPLVHRVGRAKTGRTVYFELTPLHS
jgi:PPOX class probable F420-dependent enzyme